MTHVSLPSCSPSPRPWPGVIALAGPASAASLRSAPSTNPAGRGVLYVDDGGYCEPGVSYSSGQPVGAVSSCRGNPSPVRIEIYPIPLGGTWDPVHQPGRRPRRRGRQRRQRRQPRPAVGRQRRHQADRQDRLQDAGRRRAPPGQHLPAAEHDAQQRRRLRVLLRQQGQRLDDRLDPARLVHHLPARTRPPGTTSRRRSISTPTPTSTSTSTPRASASTPAPTTPAARRPAGGGFHPLDPDPAARHPQRHGHPQRTDRRRRRPQQRPQPRRTAPRASSTTS